jgi:hypothetical protein
VSFVGVLTSWYSSFFPHHHPPSPLITPTNHQLGPASSESPPARARTKPNPNQQNTRHQLMVRPHPVSHSLVHLTFRTHFQVEQAASRRSQQRPAQTERKRKIKENQTPFPFTCGSLRPTTAPPPHGLTAHGLARSLAPPTLRPAPRPAPAAYKKPPPRTPPTQETPRPPHARTASSTIRDHCIL